MLELQDSWSRLQCRFLKKYRALRSYLWQQTRHTAIYRDLVHFVLIWVTTSHMVMTAGNCIGLTSATRLIYINPMASCTFHSLQFWSRAIPWVSTWCCPSWARKRTWGVAPPPVQFQPINNLTELCPLQALAVYMQACQAPKAPAGSTIQEYLFQPLQPDHSGFKECAISSFNLTYRLRQYFAKRWAIHRGNLP